MASLPWVVVASFAAFILYSLIGAALAPRIIERRGALLLAPMFGWAVFSAATLPLFCFIIPLSLATAASSFALAGACAVFFAAPSVRLKTVDLVKSIDWQMSAAFVGAILLASAIAAGTLPKFSDGGVTLASPIFDHAKIAMVDEMRRIGVPPVNPFYGGTDAPQRLAYYYLWHFSAAELSLLTHASGWEADAALTWFTAFASLMAMAGVARLLGGGRWTPLFVVILAASASARPVLYTLMGDDPVESIVGVRSGLAGWMFQAMWAPQHCAAAACLVLAVGALGPMVRTPSLVRSITVALLMAATFEASTWIGGIVLPLAVIPVAVALLIKTAPAGRMRTFAVLAATGVLAMLLIAPLFYDQIQAAMSRGTTLITFRPYEVLSSSVLVSQSGRVANLVAYWLLFLPVEFLASYVVGVLTLIFLLRRRASGASDEIWPYCILILASLISTWLFASTYGDNNDLGWRSVLPAASALIIFAAIGFEILIVTKRSVALVAACVLLLLTAPDSGILIYRNVVGHRSDSARIFAGTPALWEAVRKHAGITERVANNPEFLADLTPWDVNISWALLANRRSCYAGDALVGPFSALPEQRALAVQQQFDRIFSGNAEPEDLKALLTEYRCDAVVLTAEDPAWPHDPFATSSLYRLVDSASGWRIYRRAD